MLTCRCEGNPCGLAFAGQQVDHLELRGRRCVQPVLALAEVDLDEIAGLLVARLELERTAVDDVGHRARHPGRDLLTVDVEHRAEPADRAGRGRRHQWPRHVGSGEHDLGHDHVRSVGRLLEPHLACDGSATGLSATAVSPVIATRSVRPFAVTTAPTGACAPEVTVIPVTVRGFLHRKVRVG